VQLATGNIVQKRYWFGAQFQKIVGGQGKKIVAYVLVQLVLQGEMDLGPHSLGGLRNDWLLVAEFLQAEQSSKTAQATKDARSLGAAGQGLDALHQCISSIDIHSAVLVTQSRGAGSSSK